VGNTEQQQKIIVGAITVISSRDPPNFPLVDVLPNDDLIVFTGLDFRVVLCRRRDSSNDAAVRTFSVESLEEPTAAVAERSSTYISDE
jgi:hypothetical protein